MGLGPNAEDWAKTKEPKMPAGGGGVNWQIGFHVSQQEKLIFSPP